MILDNEFNGDLRVENEVNSLTNAGHNVSVLCYNHGNNNKKSFGKTKLVRFLFSKKNKDIFRGLNNTFFNFYPLIWALQISTFIRNEKIDVLHVHDLWMMEAALIANKRFKLPIVLDLHENFISALDHYKYVNTFPGNILISKKRWKRKEHVWMKKADQIIVVIEEAKRRVEKFDLKLKEIYTVPNYVDIQDFSNDDKALTNNLISKYKDKITLTYTGGFDLHRGLEIVIGAVPEILKTIPNFHLLLVGGGSNFEDLKELVSKLGIEDHVEFPGFLPHKELPSYIKASNYCIVPHLKTFHTDNTIPHKLFQYMLMKKPVLVSNCDPLKRIVEESKAGLVYQNDSSQDLSSKFLKLFHSNENFGEKGIYAVNNKYNWNESAKELCRLYENINNH